MTMIIFCLIEYIYFDLMYSNHTIHTTQSKFKVNYNFHYTASVSIKEQVYRLLQRMVDHFKN